MKRVIKIACWSFALLLIAGSGWAGDDQTSLKRAWKRAGVTIKQAATETGHAIRDVGKTTGREVTKVSRDADDSTGNVREDAASEGRGFWSEAKSGLANALGVFSDAVSELTSGTD